jgi:cytochrome b subunit of formate dehydrogenase
MEEETQGKKPNQIKFSEKMVFWSLVIMFIIYVTGILINLFLTI